MSFGYHTPESLLIRADSKNPATTCKGLTTVGRPCRRALAANTTSSPTPSPRGKVDGVVAILDAGDAAAFFCWQHKDQAEALVTKLNERTQVLPLKQKSSIDTLINRIGVIEIDDEVGNYNQGTHIRRQTSDNGRQRHHQMREPRKRDTLPHEWQRIQGPLMSVPEEVAEYEGYRRPRQEHRPSSQRTSERLGRSNVKASWSCCITTDDDDVRPAPRRREYGRDSESHRKRREEHSRTISYSSNLRPGSQSYTSSTRTSVPRKSVDNHGMQQRTLHPAIYPQLQTPPSSTNTTPTRPLIQPRVSSSLPNSQTAAFLSLIPSHLAPAITSSLLGELSKPISSADEEGYIYIFWLTPESDTLKPDDETASSLLDADDFVHTSSPSRYPAAAQRTSRCEDDLNRHQSPNHRHQNKTTLTAKALQRFASINRGPSEPKKVLLKIGRANNVHRRLSQWTKQCGQNITLIRYYPYEPSDLVSSASPALTQERKRVPHVHRVERLIHLELAEQRVADKGKCDQCGREHKEWFEVEATREGVRAVDEVVRRWTGWAQRLRS